MLGIDVSQRELVATLVSEQTRTRADWTWTVPNTAEGIRQLLQRAPATSAWVIEPTGQYSRLVVRQGQDAGRSVFLAPPREAQAFLRSQPHRAKTDRLDSEGLARYAYSTSLRPFVRKSAVVESVEQLLTARCGLSQAISRLTQQRQALPAAKAILHGTIADLRARRDELDRQLNHLIADSDLAVPVAHLRTIPGVGLVTACTVAACLQAHQFTHPDQFVAFTGLDVRVRQSGQWRGQEKLTHHGSAEIRRLLWLAAASNQRGHHADNPFVAQYTQEQAKGLPTTAALCAVARKLARTCWSIHKHGTTFDPARVHHQPGIPETTEVDKQP